MSLSSAPACSCPVSAKYACDPYDSNIKLICNNGGTPFLSQDCSTLTPPQTCINGACADPLSVVNPCTSNDDFKFVPVLPDCTARVFCIDSTTTGAPPEECDDGLYFDPVTEECMALPPKPCTTCDGPCPDPFNCTF